MKNELNDTKNGQMQDITYPFEIPQPGETLQVAPGVHWLRLPLPGKLDHVNLWLIDDPDGDDPTWTLIDTGVRSDESANIWNSVCARSSLQYPVRRVLITHMHPDHAGMAGWLLRTWGHPQTSQLWMTRQEYLNCRVSAADKDRPAPEDDIRFYQQAGWSASSIDTYRKRFGRFSQLTHPLPDSYQRIVDGQNIAIGGHLWRVIVCEGHSIEHACLYCAELKLLISGDQVLPSIASNISVHPIEPDANPMAQWFASMERLKAEVPNDVLVLSSHNNCFYGLHSRIDQLMRGQSIALDRLRRALGKQGLTATEAFTALFGWHIDDSDPFRLKLATGQSIASLNYLTACGEAVRYMTDDGVLNYALANN